MFRRRQSPRHGKAYTANGLDMEPLAAISIGPSSMNGTAFTAAEMEFLAENSTVQVEPSVRMETLHCIAGDYGPFRPMVKASVPLWLAIALRKTQSFRICPPEWLSPDFLQQVLDNEERNRDEYQQIPFHYMEVAMLLLESAADDIQQSELIRRQLQSIRELRLAKTQKGISAIDGTSLMLNNLSGMELNEVRPFLLEAMDKAMQLNEAELYERSLRSRAANHHTDTWTDPTNSSLYSNRVL